MWDGVELVNRCCQPWRNPLSWRPIGHGGFTERERERERCRLKTDEGWTRRECRWQFQLTSDLHLRKLDSPFLCVCVCVCVRERERERRCLSLCVWSWNSVCVRVREWNRKKVAERPYKSSLRDSTSKWSPHKKKCHIKRDQTMKIEYLKLDF